LEKSQVGGEKSENNKEGAGKVSSRDVDEKNSEFK